MKQLSAADDDLEEVESLIKMNNVGEGPGRVLSQDSSEFLKAEPKNWVLWGRGES